MYGIRVEKHGIILFSNLQSGELARRIMEIIHFAIAIDFAHTLMILERPQYSSIELWKMKMRRGCEEGASRGGMRRIVVGCGMSGVCLVIGESIDDDDDDDDDSQLIRLNQQKQ
ncbi:hypothetical protein T09_4832 [Trichinella sp. T9]|nr:hypothetical protein T09_4832 [Trichinella sp. T9]